MDAKRNLKRQHERFVCDTLAGSIGLRAEFQRYGDDLHEPDCIYEVQTESLGIEVVTIYPRDIDAEQVWTEARGERQFSHRGYEFQWGGSISNSADLLRARIQKKIDEKCTKLYTGAKRFWLCIQETSKSSDQKTVEYWLNSIEIPKGHVFEAIYLLSQQPTWRAFKIWPK